MRSEILTSLIVVALCAGTVAAEQPLQPAPGDILIMAAEDPNVLPPESPEDPNAWDPAKHLRADWESISVSMTSRLYNPAVRPDQEAKGAEWSLTLTGGVTVIDSNGLIGLSPTARSPAAFDEDEQVVSSTPAVDMPVRWYRQPPSMWLPVGLSDELTSRLRSYHFSLSLPMAPDAVYPETLSRVEWSMYALLAKEFKTVDIPFAASDTWVELAPGMEVLMEQAIAEENRYEYRIKVKYDKARADFLMGGSVHLWRDEAPPAVVVLETEVLNAEGQPVRNLGGGSFGTSGSGSNNEMTVTGRGTCDACGTAATLRYTLAFQLSEREIWLALENVPVPGF